MSPGKTLADLVDTLLSDWAKFFRFLFLATAIIASILLLAWAVPKALGLKLRGAQEFQISTGGFLLRSASGDRVDYVVIVHPQGWEDSGIALRRGDRVKFHAGGSVNIDLEGIVSKVELRKKLEKQITQARKIDRSSEEPSQLPEHYFTEEQVKQLRPNRPWAGPEGNTEAVYTSFAARRRQRILPEKPVAALVGALTDGSQRAPERSDAFFIGRSFEGQELSVLKDGELWLSVNDVWNTQNPRYPNMFFDDNIGFFWVNVHVTRGENQP